MRNDFICLPKSFIQLSNLNDIFLGGCTQLQMLPKLPLNIAYIDARGCTSLETLSLSLEYDFRQNIYLHNCVKLLNNQGYGELLSTILRHYISEVSFSLSLSISLSCIWSSKHHDSFVYFRDAIRRIVIHISQFLEVKFRNGTGTKMWGLQWIYKCHHIYY